jgi:hypothetical protein
MALKWSQQGCFYFKLNEETGVIQIKPHRESFEEEQHFTMLCTKPAFTTLMKGMSRAINVGPR